MCWNVINKVYKVKILQLFPNLQSLKLSSQMRLLNNLGFCVCVCFSILVLKKKNLILKLDWGGGGGTTTQFPEITPSRLKNEKQHQHIECLLYALLH